MTQVCEKCGDSNDIKTIRVAKEAQTLCLQCRAKLVQIDGLPRNQGARKPGAGRPTLGVTKKISVTLPEETWEWLDGHAEGNRSELLRRMIIRARNLETTTLDQE